jgi:4'-phosphopantetheinyl transferase
VLGTALREEEVHVWLADPSRCEASDRAARYRALLTPDEAARCDQFGSAEHRHRYLTAHALIRCTLSRYAEVDPREWKFGSSEYGRPEIQGPARHGLSFNISRTRNLVVCAIALSPEVGVDVESLDGRAATLPVADRFFRPAEIIELRSLPPGRRRGRFFDFWTLKEAYVKARGRGLQIPLVGFTFHVAPSISIEIDDAQEDATPAWHFALWSPTPRHRAALAVCRPLGAPPLVTQMRWWWG